MAGEEIIIAVIYLLPLAGIGTFYLYMDQINPRLKTRSGHVKIQRLSPSGKLIKKWVKPEIETIDGEIGYFFKMGEERIPFFDTGETVYNGENARMAIYDTEGNQVAINRLQKWTPQVSPKMLDSLIQRTWNLARATGLLQNKNFLMLLILAAGGGLIATVMTMIVLGQVSGLTETVTNMAGQVSAIQSTVDSLNITVVNAGTVTPIEGLINPLNP